ncbi:MAG: glycosyltransferase family 4 protein [Bacteroidetes bacterium]|nr:glycosyltransferase family 4 protein [Bacteroidota bacterium]
MKVTIIHAGGENSYLFGLVNGLSKINNLIIDVIDSERSVGLFQNLSNVNFYNFRPSLETKARLGKKVFRILSYYYKLAVYTMNTDSYILHIQWLNKFVLLDRTLLNLYYKLAGKKIVFTAHNINAKKRDNKDNFINRFSLRIHYKLVDHIIVHNRRMKDELIKDFNVNESKVSVIPIGLNIKVPQLDITKKQAIDYLNLPGSQKYILFFGGIIYYKGLDLLIKAVKLLLDECEQYHLIIAGEPRDKVYYHSILELLKNSNIENNVTHKFCFIPDNEIPYYFIASDCCVLPYRNIFQSGVHVLSYSYGLPVIASDIGSFKDEDIIEGQTGYIFKPSDYHDLKLKLKSYFSSRLYNDLGEKRSFIKKWGREKYSWTDIGKSTLAVYQNIYKQESM